MHEFYRAALGISAAFFAGVLFKILVTRKLSRTERVWTFVPAVLIAALAVGFKFLG